MIDLAQYGVLGLWTMTLIAEKYYNKKEMKTLIENNTITIAKNTEVMKKCQKNQN